jgi:AraC-like DNA-binding protein
MHRVDQRRSVVSGIEAMALCSDRSFPRHSHDQLAIGVVTSGAHRSWSDRGLVEAEAGDVIMANPGELHDGLPGGRTAREWWILYVDPTLVAGALSEECIRGELVVPPVVRDARLADHVRRLFRHVGARDGGALAAESDLLAAVWRILRCHRPGSASALATPSPAVAAAVRRIDDAPHEAVSLSELAALAGVSRFQLLRGFARSVGATPHAYLVQRRVRLVRQLIAGGVALADAAVQAGFADQSHMTRAFVRQIGITPGRYRAALA